MIDSPFPPPNFPLSLSVAYLLPSHVLSATPPQSPGRLSSPRASLPHLSYRTFASSSSMRAPLPSVLRPSSVISPPFLVPPFAPLSFPPFPPSSRSPSSLLPSPSPHFIENVWYAGAFYTGTEPPPVRSNGRQGATREATRKDFGEREKPRRDAWPSTLAAKVLRLACDVADLQRSPRRRKRELFPIVRRSRIAR